jgi:hypothetical protein
VKRRIRRHRSLDRIAIASQQALIPGTNITSFSGRLEGSELITGQLGPSAVTLTRGQASATADDHRRRCLEEFRP